MIDFFFVCLFVLGAELQRTHHHSPTRITLHLLPPLPASPTLHSHRQQYPAHHKRIKVSPACPGLHWLLGGTQREPFHIFFPPILSCKSILTLSNLVGIASAEISSSCPKQPGFLVKNA